MSTNLGKFTNQADACLRFLIRKCPGNKDFKVSYEKFLWLKEYNPKLLLTLFLQYVYPIKSHIVNRNLSFFLNEKIDAKMIDNSQLNNISSQVGINSQNVDAEMVINKALNLREIFKNTFDEKSTEVLFKHFEGMCKHCENYVIDSMNLKAC